jgi:hypothetical protein
MNNTPAAMSSNRFTVKGGIFPGYREKEKRRKPKSFLPLIVKSGERLEFPKERPPLLTTADPSRKRTIGKTLSIGEVHAGAIFVRSIKFVMKGRKNSLFPFTLPAPRFDGASRRSSSFSFFPIIPRFLSVAFSCSAKNACFSGVFGPCRFLPSGFSALFLGFPCLSRKRYRVFSRDRRFFDANYFRGIHFGSATEGTDFCSTLFDFSTIFLFALPILTVRWAGYFLRAVIRPSRRRIIWRSGV